MQGEVMGTRKKTTQKMNSTGAVLALLGLASAGSLDLSTGGLPHLLGIPLKVAIEALPAIVLAAWHMLPPCAFGRPWLLEGIVQISACCWQCVLALAGLA